MMHKSKYLSFWAHYLFQKTINYASLSKAATIASVSQPAVSQAIQGLNSLYDCVLLERNGKQMRCTPQGTILYARVQMSLRIIETCLHETFLIDKHNVAQQMRAMSPRRIEGLLSVVRHGGFTPAAKEIGIAVPTLHRALRGLELSIGTAFFEKTSHGVAPTRKADILADCISLALSELGQANTEINAQRGFETGRITIGAMPLARSYLVPAVIAKFSEIYPRHFVSVVEGHYDDLLASLKRGDSDVLVGALRGLDSGNEISEEFLFNDTLAIIMRADHPLAGKVKLSKKDINTFPWIAPRQQSPLRRHFDQLFTRDTDENTIECNSLTVARGILERTDRLMLLSDAQIGFEQSVGMLVSKPLPKEAVSRSIGMTVRTNWRPTDAQHSFIEMLRQEAV